MENKNKKVNKKQQRQQPVEIVVILLLSERKPGPIMPTHKIPFGIGFER